MIFLGAIPLQDSIKSWRNEQTDSWLNLTISFLFEVFFQTCLDHIYEFEYTIFDDVLLSLVQT